MMPNEIIIVQRNLSVLQLKSYFKENDDLFGDTLLKRVNIDDYTEKIGTNAVHFCAFSGKEMAGLLVCYFNHPFKEFGYITSISVRSKFQQKGLAKRLMNQAIDYAKINGFHKLRLEVSSRNLPAIKLYNALGFIMLEKIDNNLFLESTI